MQWVSQEGGLVSGAAFFCLCVSSSFQGNVPTPSLTVFPILGL
jgi:hypothetical protein